MTKHSQYKKLTIICIKILFFLQFVILTYSCQTNLPANVSDEMKSLPKVVDFNYHIKPILSDRCFACHGPDQNNQKAGLRLDIPEAAFASLVEEENAFAIVPGKLDESEIYHRIISDDPERVMPPPESHLSLTNKEKALIIKWIEQGAEYKSHWSFVPPKMPERPNVRRGDWGQNMIDAFVLQKMEEKGFVPNEEADKYTLIRRLTLDLTGLPPTPEEITSFVEDNTPEAYYKLVERLLASEHYGEQMAVEWLDLARYADSHGYQDDGMRNVWPWRDWVIDAFNQNMPYDTFLIWQLAGDLLPNPTKDQLLATTFNRNHMQSQEGGIVEAEYRAQNVHDRVKTVTKAFMGLTMECAQCHDHKYDPISQKEYYEFYSFFNQVDEYGQIPYVGTSSPSMILTDSGVDSIKSQLENTILKLEPKVAIDNPVYDSTFNKWKKNGEKINGIRKGLIGYFSFENRSQDEYRNYINSKYPALVRLSNADDPPKITQGKIGKGVKFIGESFVAVKDSLGWFEKNEPFSVSLWINVLTEESEGPIFTRNGGLMNGNRGYGCILKPEGRLNFTLNQVWPNNSIEVETIEPIERQKWQLLTVSYDGSGKAKGIHLFLDDKEVKYRILHDNLTQSIRYAKDHKNWGNAGFWLGRSSGRSIEDLKIDEVRIFERALSHLEVAYLAGNYEMLATDEDKLKEYFIKQHSDFYDKWNDTLKHYRGELTELLTHQPSIMIMKDRLIPRPTFILDRGEYDAPTEEVFPATPRKIKPFLNEERPDRLGLAKWLLAPDHPLTSRVTVNRIWQKFFGQGIVKTSDDFGNQGDLPTHPELLDYLSLHLIDLNWNVKDLIREIVHTQAYRQSSIVSDSIRKLDPDNKWLARGPSFRLSAEMVRDHALASSDLLHDTIGGPSVKPYQPLGLWKELATRNAVEYVQDHGKDLYRRSMYTIWKRTTPPPMMISFDATTRNFCEVKRQKTSTPLQALVLLNDPQFLEACRVLAANIIQENPYDFDVWINQLFLKLIGRYPSPEEAIIAAELFNEELQFLKKNPNEVEELLCVGESVPINSGPDYLVGAFTMVTNMVMNSDAFVIKR